MRIRNTITTLDAGQRAQFVKTYRDTVHKGLNCNNITQYVDSLGTHTEGHAPFDLGSLVEDVMVAEELIRNDMPNRRHTISAQINYNFSSNLGHATNGVVAELSVTIARTR